jgi:tRNA 2-selenouridine synthase
MFKTIDTPALIENFDDFELLIDARSSSEYAHSHIPGAINLYALNNDEHKEVGTLYKHGSKNRAKILGASYICQNASRHIQFLGKEKKIGSKIAIYCARGGMRSESLGIIFSNIGYRIYKLEDGYKSFRSYVVKSLESKRQEKFIVLGGNTGCGKTEIIKKCKNAINLEGLANHFGSSFGAINGKQPSQKMFQNRLFFALLKVNKNWPVIIESESKRIGSIILPDSLYKAMQEGIRVEVKAPFEQRIERILRDYKKIDRNFFYKGMEKISPYIKKSLKLQAIEAFEKNELKQVAAILLLEYYDKVYKKPSKIDFQIDNSNLQKALESLDQISLHVKQKYIH